MEALRIYAGALQKDKKQIPFGNDRKKSNCEYDTTGEPQAFLSVFAFLSFIPEGNLLFEFLKRSGKFDSQHDALQRWHR